MNSMSEDRSSPPNSSADDKRLNVSYTRGVLLSLADLTVCKRLPSSFDPSIMCETKDASSGSSSSHSEAGRWNSNLSRRGLPENGFIGKGAQLKEPKCVLGVSSPGIQGIVHPDSTRLKINISPQSKPNTERGLLGSGSFKRDPESLAGVSGPLGEGSPYNLLNKSAEPYRPPHLSKNFNHKAKEISSCMLSSTSFVNHSVEEEKISVGSISTGIVNDKPKLHIPSHEQNLDEKASEVDIILPDEDSLITLDDLVFPLDPVLPPGIPRNMPIAPVNKPNSPNSISPYDTMHARSYSLFQKNPGSVAFCHSEIMPPTLNSYTRDLSRESGTSVKVHPGPYYRPFPEPTRFGYSAQRPISPQVTLKFPHQSYDMPSDFTRSFP